MNENWTPGPWIIERHDHHSHALDVVGGEESAIGEIYVDWDGEAEGTANAHLISAAPEMYDALKLMVELHGNTNVMPTEQAHRENAAARMAISALKKARGEK